MMRVAHPYDGLLDLFVGWLGSNKPEEFVPAVEYLCRAGSGVSDFLIEAAAKPGTPSAHQYRLLSLVSKIGGQRGPVENHYLRTLRRHDCPLIREKAKELFVVLPVRRTSRRTGLGIGVRGMTAVAGKLAFTENQSRAKTIANAVRLVTKKRQQLIASPGP